MGVVRVVTMFERSTGAVVAVAVVVAKDERSTGAVVAVAVRKMWPTCYRSRSRGVAKDVRKMICVWESVGLPARNVTMEVLVCVVQRSTVDVRVR